MLIATHFEQFKKSFSSRNVMVEKDYLVYRTPRGYSDKLAEDANLLIEKLNLPLVAIPTKFISKDSFLIKSNETFDV
jgi:hypothetical protein